jgi:flagellar hook assembly protein FlgD
MSQQIELKIYDILGKEISTLVNKKQNHGNYQVQWDGKNNDGIKVSNGVYLYRLKAGSFVTTKKMIFLQ